MKVLCLDDNNINRVIVSKMLGKEHIIDCVENAEEAFKLFSQNEYDVVLIDINLNDPIIDGFGVLQKLKSTLDSTKNIKFIAHSNYIDDDWEERCNQAGFDAFLPKPFKLDVFSTMISKLLL